MPSLFRRRPFRRSSRQRGTSVLGLVFLAIVVGFFMLMGARVFPVLNEYFTIRRAVAQIMKGSPASANDIRSAFEKTSEVEYSIHSLQPKDLIITPKGDGFTTTYKYDVEIPVIEPVFVLIKFEGSASSAATTGP